MGPVRKSLGQTLVSDDTGDEGRIALGHVVLGLPPLVDILHGGLRDESIALAKRRCRTKGKRSSGRIAC
jgi:hypothetical protein